jgi:hypothetical protein
MLLLGFSSVTLVPEMSAQNTPTILTFQVSPIKHTFSRHEEIVLRFKLRNDALYHVFVSRKMFSEFVDLTILGPTGKEASWGGSGRIDSKGYSPEDFAVLKTMPRLRHRQARALPNKG